MGPRSWDRGEFVKLGAIVNRRGGFNGAAGLGPRRADENAPIMLDKLQASMEPRSWDRGEQRLIQLESGVKRASMGPRSWDRGEDDYRRRDASAETGFNGAAVLGPRRAHRGAQHSRGHRPASMGPRSWDRGEREAARLSAEAASASMGPRSWDRGERRSLLHRLVVFLTLQWGRGLGTAERAPAIGGRARLDGASMGPRSWDRGESRRRRVPLRARRFNGAAVLGPRRVSVAEARARWSHGFNGAAVLGPRRGWWRRTGFHRASRFNGAAVLGPRRVP